MPDQEFAARQTAKQRVGELHHVHHDHIRVFAGLDDLILGAELELLADEVDAALPQDAGFPVEVALDVVGDDNLHVLYPGCENRRMSKDE
jgi:hypothetical protein